MGLLRLVEIAHALLDPFLRSTIIIKGEFLERILLHRAILFPCKLDTSDSVS